MTTDGTMSDALLAPRLGSGSGLEGSLARGVRAVTGWLDAIAPEERDGLVAEAERLFAERGQGFCDAALVLACRRAAAREWAGAADAAGAVIEAAALPDTEVAQLRRILHAAFEGGARVPALVSYRQLVARGVEDALSLIRLIDDAVARRDADAAAPLVARYAAHHAQDTNPWGPIGVARYRLLRGEREHAAAAIIGLPSLAASNPAAEAVIQHCLIEADQLDAAAGRAAADAAGPSVQLFGARLRRIVRGHAAGAIAELLEDPRCAELPDWLLVDTMFQLLDGGRLSPAQVEPLADRVHALLKARDPTDGAVARARIEYLRRARRWDALGTLLSAVASSDVAASPTVLLARFEFLCQVGDAAAAYALYTSELRDRALDMWDGVSVMRLLVGLARWDEAGGRLLAHLRAGHGFGNAAHIGLKIVRRCGLHRRIIAEAKGAPSGSAERAAFIALVTDDLALAPPVPRPAAAPAATAEAPPDRCVFFCVDRRYFLGLLTCLCSLLGRRLRQRVRILVFLDDDVPRSWHAALSAIAARFGQPIEIIDERQFMPPDIRLRRSHGFFTAGDALSHAAYFRIYAVRWLLGRKEFRRAAYLDADTICRADVTDLLDFDLGAASLAAAVEDPTQEVRMAAMQHGLAAESYFNSGVLLLRMDDPTMPERIAAAIAVAEDAQERLVLHDQCALNIAFRGASARLPDRWNFFLRKNWPIHGPIAEAGILHFLDTPKPWDVSHQGVHGEEWRAWAVVVQTLIPDDLFRRLLAAANQESNAPPRDKNAAVATRLLAPAAPILAAVEARLAAVVQAMGADLRHRGDVETLRSAILAETVEIAARDELARLVARRGVASEALMVAGLSFDAEVGLSVVVRPAMAGAMEPAATDRDAPPTAAVLLGPAPGGTNLLATATPDLGDPAGLPPGWRLAMPEGVSWRVVRRGVEFGMPFVEVVCVGHAPAATEILLQFAAPGRFIPTAGSALWFGAALKLSGGRLPPFVRPHLALAWHRRDGRYVRTQTEPIPAVEPGLLRALTFGAAFGAPGDKDYSATPGISFWLHRDTEVDMTLMVGPPWFGTAAPLEGE